MHKKIIRSILLIFGLCVSFSFCSADWIYRNQSDWLISIVVNWITKYTIQDKNVGATTVFSQDYSQDTCWKYFQRWNNYWFPFNWPLNVSSTPVDTFNYWPWNYYSSDVFIKTSYNWSSNNNQNLWWDTTNTLEARKWPCDEWFHVPSFSELEDFSSLYQSLWLSSISYFSYLKFWLCWYIHNSLWSLSNQGVYWFYWSSTPFGSIYAKDLALNYWNNYFEFYNDWRSYWVSVRWFKNIVVDPTSSRTVLYWDPIEDTTPTDPILRVNYWNTSYDYILTDILEIKLNSPVLKDGDNYSYNWSTWINLFYNWQSQFYNKSELFLFTPSWYSANIFNPICL